MTADAQQEAIERWKKGQPLSWFEVRTMRSYLVEWIGEPERNGPAVERLRESVRHIRTEAELDNWLLDALSEGHWPLDMRDL